MPSALATTVVILNPASGLADENFRATVESALRANGVSFELWETTPATGGRELATRALAQGARHIIAAGGDGTVMAVVNGLGKLLCATREKSREAERNSVENRVALSIIPGGTANLLAGALKIPTSVADAVKVAMAGEAQQVDLGRCGQHLFALGVGLGLTEKLVSQTSAREKEAFGKWAYAKAMLAEMGQRPTTFAFKLDDGAERVRRGVAIVVANAGQIGGNLQFAPDARMDDGLLDLCILHHFYFRDLLRMAGRSLLGLLQEDRAVSFFQAKRIEIHAAPPLDIQIDGEVVDMKTPLRAEILPGVLSVHAPRHKTAARQ